jgi:hypothetical protein
MPIPRRCPDHLPLPQAAATGEYPEPVFAEYRGIGPAPIGLPAPALEG